MLRVYTRLLDLLDARERRNFLLLIGMITVMGLFEMIGVAIILPFLAVVADPGVIETNPVLAWTHALLAPPDTETFLIWLGLLVFAVIFVGMLVKIGTMYAISRFSLMRGYHISARILEGYLSQPYAWFLNQSSPRLSKTILDETNRAMGSVMVPALRLVAQYVTLVFLLGFLIYVDATVAIGATLVIAVFYGGIFLAVREMLRRMGLLAIEANTARYRTVTEALQGVKAVKLGGLETHYARRFRTPARQQARATLLIQFVGEFPRFVLETIAFGGMVLLVLVFLIRDSGNLADVLPTMGLFVLAGLRILNAVQQIFKALSTLRAGQPVLDVIHADILHFRQTSAALAGPDDRAPLPLTRALVFENVDFTYPAADHVALKGVDLCIPARSTVGIVGGTGAGKTTVIDLVLGLLRPDAGRITIDGQPLEKETLRAWQKSLGYVPQDIYLTDDTVAANIAFGVPEAEIDMEAVIRAARTAELHDFVTTRMADGYGQIVGDRGVRLSGGQRQRIGIARALYHDPQLLILDEATSALDNITEEAVMAAVSNLGDTKTVIMIAHRLTTVQNCDRIFLMAEGRIVDSGTYDDLIARNPTFRKMARVT